MNLPWSLTQTSEFGKPALRKMGPAVFKPAEQLQAILDQGTVTWRVSPPSLTGRC